MQRTKDTMFPLIEKWEQSGQTQTDFVKDHDLTLSCFSYWRGAYLRIKSEDDTDASGFIPVEQDLSMRSGMIELIFPSGVRAVFYQANPELIRALVR